MTTKRIDTKREANINYTCGSTGAGKSFQIKKEIKGRQRLAIFDPDGEYSDIAGVKTVYSPRELVQALSDNPTSKLKIRFIAEGREAFEVFCAAVFAWCNCTIVAEEIADVTTPQKAPPMWGRLLRRGRKRGIEMFITTQRPSEADKTAFSQCTRIRCGQLGTLADRAAMAKNMDIDIQHVNALMPLDYILKDKKTGLITKGHKGRKTGEIVSLAAEKAKQNPLTQGA